MRVRRIYLAGPFTSRDELRTVRDRLVADGHTVTSGWLAWADEADGTHDRLSGRAMDDLDDVTAADTLIMRTGVPTDSGHGWHTEFGYAAALGKRLVVVGPRENIFHHLPAVRVYPDWDALYAAWGTTAPFDGIKAEDLRIDVYRNADVWGTGAVRLTHLPSGEEVARSFDHRHSLLETKAELLRELEWRLRT